MYLLVFLNVELHNITPFTRKSQYSYANGPYLLVTTQIPHNKCKNIYFNPFNNPPDMVR